MLVKLMPTSTNSLQTQRTQASSAALPAIQAEKRRVLLSTPIELCLRIRKVNLFAFSFERFRDQALMDEASGALDDIVH